MEIVDIEEDENMFLCDCVLQTMDIARQLFNRVALIWKGYSYQGTV